MEVSTDIYIERFFEDGFYGALDHPEYHILIQKTKNLKNIQDRG